MPPRKRAPRKPVKRPEPKPQPPLSPTTQSYIDSSPAYRRSSTPSGTSHPSVVRWDPPVYAALKQASAFTNTSMTVIANTAVANYLASPEVQTQIDAARAAQDDAIRKLSGG